MKKLFLASVAIALLVACGDDSTPASDTGTPDSTTSDTGTPDSTVADSTAGDGATDTGTTDGASDGSAGDGSADGSAGDGATDAGNVIGFCTSGGDCDTDEMCFQANTTCSSEMGFCIGTGAATCGGIAGTMCPDGTECVMESPTCGGADLTGVCVEPAERTAICAEQPSLWNCG